MLDCRDQTRVLRSADVHLLHMKGGVAQGKADPYPNDSQYNQKSEQSAPETRAAPPAPGVYSSARARPWQGPVGAQLTHGGCVPGLFVCAFLQTIRAGLLHARLLTALVQFSCRERLHGLVQQGHLALC